MNDIKTSQTQWSLPEGQNAPGVSAVQYKTDSAGPKAVTQPIKGEITTIDAMQTSQQRAGEHHTPESQ